MYHKGPLPLGKIGTLLLVSAGNITFVVNQLERRGLVKRERQHADRRVIYASLTPRGKEMLDQIYPPHADFIIELFSALTSDELRALHRLLKKLGLAVTVGEGDNPR